MRVAIITPVFPPYRGGIGTVAAHDAQLLCEGGCDVTIFTPAYKNRLHGLECGVEALRPWYAWGNAAVLLDLIPKLKGYDIAHLHYPFFGTDIIVAFAAALWKIPLVVTCHMRPKARGVLGFTFWAYRHVLELFIFRVAHTVLVSSDEYADVVGVHHRDRRPFAFSVDVKRFSPGEADIARKKFGIHDDRPVILFVGGLDRAHYFKGVDVLLAAVARMSIRANLLIVGDGDCRRVFEDKSQLLGISDRVHFAGSVSVEDLPDAYRAATVHALPSLDRSEAFGIVTLEAMASGVPSIVSDLPGVRTLVIPGQTGALASPGNVEELTQQLDHFCGDIDFSRHCGAFARVRAEKEYSDSIFAEKLLSLYRSLLLGK